jgi:hypothetical protein
MASGSIREAVGVFPDEISFRGAGDERLISGLDGSDIGVVAGRRWVERQFGAMYEDVAEVLDGPETPRAVMRTP